MSLEVRLLFTVTELRPAAGSLFFEMVQVRREPFRSERCNDV
jgi:hypothetical protein